MRNSLKRTIAIAAATLTAGALALTACSSSFKHPSGLPTAGAAVLSNGGFAVQKGEYVYFINGVETNESDNTYGDVVKGSLQRIKTEDLDKKDNQAETVIPSLMVAEDYDAGIYIYGDRIYYATPNNVKNTSGEIERDYLDFKSAKLDGSDIKSYFNVSSASTEYRYVEVGDVVYVLYVESTVLHSYNTATGADTVLAKGGTEYVLNSSDKGDPWAYYVMSVTDGYETGDPDNTLNYTQIYRVRADATEAAYECIYDDEYLEEYVKENGEEPYINLGELVLDGIGGLYSDMPTQFTHDLKEGVTPLSPGGYTYTLQSYENDGLYFLRTDLTGEDDRLYYLPVSALGEGWNSVTGNQETTATTKGSLDVVALPANTSKASSSALFYITEENGTRQHHYLYVSSAGNIHRADVRTDGTGTIENDMYGEVKQDNQVGMIIAYDVSGATLVSRDTASSTVYDYVYFTRSSGAGNSVERAVYNGIGRYYENLEYEGENHKPYQPVKVLDVQHASSWYSYEIIEGRLFYANSESLGASNYIAYVDLRKADGTLMNNEELEAVNEKYEKITGDDGVLAKLNSDGETSLATAIKYYFYTGETRLFDENVQEAIDAGKKATALYTQDEQDRFHAFAKGEDDAEEYGEARKLSYFVTKIGKMTDEDIESVDEYWKGQLQRYIATETDDGALEGWEIALIVIAVCLVVIGGGVAAFFLVRKYNKEKKAAEPKPERMRVDTTDDKEVDVYSMNEPEPTAEVELEEATEAPAEAEPETATEEAIEAESEPEAEPAEENAPQAEEAPAEEPAEPEASEEPPTDQE